MFSGLRELEFIQPLELAELLQNNFSDTTAVIDCRDEDFKGGHIKGCTHVSSESLEDDAVLYDLAISTRSCKHVVVHCMKSQERGPMTAFRLINRLAIILEEQQGDNSNTNKPAVVVLRGGYEEFVRSCGDSHPALFEV
jgi:Cdc25 family phosphatase